MRLRIFEFFVQVKFLLVSLMESGQVGPRFGLDQIGIMFFDESKFLGVLAFYVLI